MTWKLVTSFYTLVTYTNNVKMLMKLRHSFCIVHFIMKWINAVLNRDAKKCVCLCVFECVQALVGKSALDFMYHTFSIASFKMNI